VLRELPEQDPATTVEDAEVLEQEDLEARGVLQEIHSKKRILDAGALKVLAHTFYQGPLGEKLSELGEQRSEAGWGEAQLKIPLEVPRIGWSTARSVKHQSKVRFDPNPKVVTFLSDLLPYELGCQCSWMRPIKKACQVLPSPILKRCSGDFKRKMSVVSSARSSEIFCRDTPTDQDNRVYTEQGTMSEQPWQVVRKRRWWRERKRDLAMKQPPPKSLQHINKFKQKMLGRCFNCLGRGHRLAQCRDPNRCWRCNGCGHISTHCSKKPFVRVCPYPSSPKSKEATTLSPDAVTIRQAPASLPLKPSAMERHSSLGGAAADDQQWRWREGFRIDREREPQGSAINYPGNPRFRPRCVFKRAVISEEMNQRCRYLTKHAVVITDEGAMVIRSREEVKDLIQFSCGIRKHDFAIYRSTPEPFIAIFHEEHDRDIVFAAGRALDGPVELAFHEWGIDRFGEREILPFQMRLCLEDIPQFAWCKEVADKVLGDEAFIHSVEEDTI
jgi:hypothetical protein